VPKYLIAGLVVLAVVLVAAFAWPWHLLRGGSPGVIPAADTKMYGPGRPVPAAAAATAQRLASGTPAEQRATLSSSLAAVLPQGTLFPAGSAIKLYSDGWHQAGDYANALGVLTEPGVGAQPVEIGFIKSGDRWLVTFEEPLS
jgi:hypothetical protein